jgi:hypothetical protein
MNNVQWNYMIHDKEMFTIIRALEKWRHVLEGAWHPVEIWMDHKNLEYFQKSQNLIWRQARWSLYLSWFDFALFHQPGRSWVIWMHSPNAPTMEPVHRTRTCHFSVPSSSMSE